MDIPSGVAGKLVFGTIGSEVVVVVAIFDGEPASERIVGITGSKPEALVRVKRGTVIGIKTVVVKQDGSSNCC